MAKQIKHKIKKVKHHTKRAIGKIILGVFLGTTLSAIATIVLSIVN